MKTWILIIAALFLTGCADEVSCLETQIREPVGFLFGVWHGMILPFSWLISLFDSDVAIYASYNNGGWYDFGFVLGVGGLSKSSSSASK